MLIDEIFKIGTQTLDPAVLISPDITGLIFGINWMQNQECLFDCARRKLEVRGEWIPF